MSRSLDGGPGRAALLLALHLIGLTAAFSLSAPGASPDSSGAPGSTVQIVTPSLPAPHTALPPAAAQTP